MRRRLPDRRSWPVWRAALGLCVWLLAAFAPAVAGDPLRVREMQVTAQPGKTRFVIELDRPVRHELFSLADPDRIVIDLPEARFPAGLARRLRPAGGMVAFRYGRFRPGITRIVIDLDRPLSLTRAFGLPATSRRGFRLVLDFATVSRARFLREARPPGGRRPAARAVPAAAPATVPAAGHPPPAAAPLPPRRDGTGAGRHVVMLDPGHGGADPGTIGHGGLHEKRVVLRIARAIARRLERTGRYRVHLTRDRDEFLDLRRRVELARRQGADLFISLHADAIADPRLRGASVYTLSEAASDKEAAALAAHVNRGIGKRGPIAGVDFSGRQPEVASILIDLAQRETMNHSARFAGQLVRALRRNRVRTLSRPHRFAGFAVLKGLDIPSVLVELGFLSNRADEKLLASPRYQETVATAMLAALDGYFQAVRTASR